jgi:arginine:agmatine antiporter
VLGYGKMPHGQYTFFVAAGLAGAIYCMIALVGSDGEQTRWSLIFVIATIVFYSASITRKRDLDEKHIHPGGKAPIWVRYLALGVTIVALVVMFWLSVGRHDDLDLRSREQAPAEAGEAAQQMAPSGVQ